MLVRKIELRKVSAFMLFVKCDVLNIIIQFDVKLFSMQSRFVSLEVALKMVIYVAAGNKNAQTTHNNVVL